MPDLSRKRETGCRPHTSSVSPWRYLHRSFRRLDWTGHGVCSQRWLTNCARGDARATGAGLEQSFTGEMSRRVANERFVFGSGT